MTKVLDVLSIFKNASLINRLRRTFGINLPKFKISIPEWLLAAAHTADSLDNLSSSWNKHAHVQ